MWVPREVFNTVSKLSSASNKGSLLCLGILNLQPVKVKCCAVFPAGFTEGEPSF